ncbi:MAG: K(+)-transporting ATPase subunit C, partial [Actinomycetota bacterium]
MRRQLLPALGMVLVFTVLTGLAYPMLVTAVAQAGFGGSANGSLVEVNGEPVGSSWIGQPFTLPQYFHPRPSSAGDGYDPTLSLGSNLGPTNDALLTAIEERVAAYREENGLGPDTLIPVDTVTGSSSGLDPHISVANAKLQAPRVAEARGLAVAEVLGLIDENTDGRGFGFLGEPGVNVLLLNLALDARG